MKDHTVDQRRVAQTHLDQIIEPLASFICAADQPHALLKSALNVLVRQVERTNQAAAAHWRTRHPGRN